MTPREIACAALRLREAAHELRSVDEAALVELVRAMRRLTQDVELRDALVVSTGLSASVVRLGLSSSFETFTRERLRGLRHDALGWERNRTRLAAVVLAGNVFTAAARALLVPLALGVPVLAKVSSRESVFPRALSAALPQPFRGALELCIFPGGSEEHEVALFSHADVIHAYGADASLLGLRRRAPAGALFVPHGHGVGVAYVDGFRSQDVEGLALDVAAYDQRGCMSPVEVLVKGDGAEAQRFAEALHGALGELDARLPRGSLRPEVAATQAQWRGVVVATGRLLETHAHAIAVEGETPLPPAPGARSLLVKATSGTAAAADRWASLGASLKVVGVNRARSLDGEFPRPRGSAPRVCALGEMQRPAFDAMADGRPAHAGLIWRIDV